MIRFFKGLLLLPIAILVVAIAVANREAVRVSFDPFSPEMPVFSLTLPLYAILFACVAIGVVVGGIGAWLGQGETARLKTYAPAPMNAGPNGVYGGDRAALPAPR